MPSKLTTIPLEKGWHRSLHAWWNYLPHYIGLLLSLPRSDQAKSTTSPSVISAQKSIFARYGIPEGLISDNGPQYTAQEFEDFSQEYNFHHTTSSPHFPQSNGHMERAVKKVKKLLKGQFKRSLHGNTVIPFHPSPMVWPLTSWASNGKVNTLQHPPTNQKAHSTMAIPGEV